MNNTFRDYFGIDINPYWDRLLGFDICKFDDEFIKSNPNETMEEAIIKKYGYGARNFIVQLIRIMPLLGGKYEVQ